MVKYCCVLFCACLLVTSDGVLSHGTESHEQETARTENSATTEEWPDPEQPRIMSGAADDSGAATQGVADHARDVDKGITFGEVIDDLTWTEFPTLHPMIVHFPVTLIPLAFVFAIVGVFAMGRTYIWLAFAFSLLGLASGWAAAFPAHPHTTGLSAAASLTLEKHDFFAYTSLWITTLAVLMAAICLWKPGRLVRVSLALVLLLSSLSIAITGHYGGALAYVHGIGAQGRFLSPH